LTGLRERRKEGTRRALEDAALRLFARDGFDDTTVDAIAAEVGVSARTFFRYFATKDEVLYGRREERQAVLQDALHAAADVAPLAALHLALVAIAPTYDRDQALLQERAVSRSAVLRGRQAEVSVSWELAMAAALAAHDDADVVAAVGMAGFRAAFVRWLRDGGELTAHLDDVFAVLLSRR
jgi:TetR/AcrR family transcriptional regulator, regulator of mycofactocin system